MLYDSHYKTGAGARLILCLQYLHRYIEVFQSNIQELRQAVVRNAARGGSGGMGGAYDRFDRDGDDEISTTARKTDHIVHMEGLPYSATERNVREVSRK